MYVDGRLICQRFAYNTFRRRWTFNLYRGVEELVDADDPVRERVLPAE